MTFPDTSTGPATASDLAQAARHVVPVAPSSGTWRPLGLDEVTITGGFLGHLQRRNAEASLAHIEHWLEHEGWLGNFDAAREGRLPADRRGREFSDSETYKLLEALAWEHGRTADPAVDATFRRIAARVLAAQEPNGYLNTAFGRAGQPARYSDLAWGHELYCAGHLVQAGVARARTAGLEDPFVQAVLRVADEICTAFGPDGTVLVDGHPEIEPALVELFRVTGERRYLDQARLFVERRGHHLLPDIELGRAYYQDDVPVREAEVLRGHAVRAAYLSAGAADLAVETDDAVLLEALEQQWERTVSARTYLTGGMGSQHEDEGFSDDFVLPADRAYSETCAGVGSIMFSWRLLLAHGEARYADLIERTLYNVLATSPSEDGKRFFYTNTLHRREPGTEPDATQAVTRAESTMRAPWFGVSCCPPNLARTFASLAGYVASVDRAGLQIHQYAPTRIRTTLADGRAVSVETLTRYPDDGRFVVRVLSGRVGRWTLSVRVPAWADGAAVVVDGITTPATPGSYVHVTRDFRSGETVELTLPMEPRVTTADPRVDAVRGCVALERGPEVLCVESVDTPDRRHVDLLRLDLSTPPVEADGAVVVRVRTIAPHGTAAWPYASSRAGAPTPVEPDPAGEGELVALRPYRTWGNRGPSTMRVWIPVA